MGRLSISEAIILGSTMNPKAIGIRHAHDGSSCALGAIEDAIGCGDGGIADFYPELFSSVVKNPVTGTLGCLASIIAGLNNHGGDYYASPVIGQTPWTREAIADWVAIIEKRWELDKTTNRSLDLTPIDICEIKEVMAL